MIQPKCSKHRDCVLSEGHKGKPYTWQERRLDNRELDRLTDEGVKAK